MARASWVLMALLAANQPTHPLYAKYEKGIEQRYKKIEDGVHGFAPLHYFSVAAAMHRLGPDLYAKFTTEYLDKLIKTQTAEGVVPLHGEDDVASTAVFACIIMMQKPGAFRPPLKKKPVPAEEPKPGAPALATGEKPRAKAADPKALAAWGDLLAERVRREIREGHPPRFHFKLIDQLAAISSLDEAGGMKLESNGSTIDYLWANFKPGDRRDVAAALAKKEDSGAMALAAFHHLACGEETAGEELLRRLPGADAERVRAAFKGN